MIKYKISVKDLISFNKHDGSLGGSLLTSSRAQLGISEHKRVQESRGEGYLKEYSLKTLIERENIALEVFGRADGIYSDTKPPIIEEIKTTRTDDFVESHMAQAIIYGYLYVLEQLLKDVKINQIGIKLLYININTGKEREINKFLDLDELKKEFNKYAEPYIAYLLKQKRWSDSRNISLKEMEFPFENFRDGQREFSIAVYRSVRDKETLFARAPTGTGKSMATIFPALKSMGEDSCSKIFYLTAKTLGRVTARDTVNILRENGARIKSVVITAKEKSCINNEYNCNPDICKYADGYYKRVYKCLKENSNILDFYQDNIEDLAYKYTVCPFELSLDLSLDCDIIICDYNYVFDLKVQLKRFFDGGKRDFTLLIDEAHNLPDRLKESYSCKIIREDLSPLLSIIKIENEQLFNKLTIINNYLLEFNKNYGAGFTKINEVPSDFIKALRSFTQEVEKDIINRDFKGKNILLDIYFNMLYFIKLSELFSIGHTFLINNSGGLGVSAEIYCIDPSYIFSKQLKKAESHIFFSASLTPVKYYTDLLLDELDFKTVTIPSPFKSENLKVIVRDDIKTTYKERNRYFSDIANIIESAIAVKEGNYMVLFPSYSFMESVLEYINCEVHIQKPGMDEGERAKYIKLFNNQKSLLSFAIMGGIFGEGIDLTGDKLIGVIVVGVGIPQISYYRDLIKHSFNYNYAYSFPGFNKVLQGVGRVIRTENDRGIAILIDARFNTPLYKSLYPNEWREIKFVKDSKTMVDNLNEFWFNN